MSQTLIENATGKIEWHKVIAFFFSKVWNTVRSISILESQQGAYYGLWILTTMNMNGQHDHEQHSMKTLKLNFL